MHSNNLLWKFSLVPFTITHRHQSALLQIALKYYVMDRLNKLKNDLSPHFVYTTEQGCLTLAQRQFYEDNGYLVIRNFLKDADIQRWTGRFLEYCDKTRPPIPGMQVVREMGLPGRRDPSVKQSQANIAKIQDFQLDEVLQSYCTNPDIIPYIKSFCGQNAKSVHTMFINKPPGAGINSRHPFHQDLAYFPFGPTNSIVAAWAALQDSNSTNGSLNIIAKTHKGRFYQHEYPQLDGKVKKAYFGIKEEQEKLEGNRIDLEMKKGDIVFFHPLLVHGSGENKTQGYRKSICCHFAAAECEYLPMEGTVQELVGKEVMSYMAKMVPGVTDYYSLWKIKSRLVCGRTFEGKL